MKTRYVDYLWLLLALCVLVLMNSCTTQKKCWKRFPPQVKDSISYIEKVRDTTIFLPGDSSMSQYLIECEETANGYKARIIQLLTQSQGERINTPTANITNNILTAKATIDPSKVTILYKELHYAAVKSQVYVKVTNELTGWQWAQVWAGRLLIASLIAYFGFKYLRRFV